MATYAFLADIHGNAEALLAVLLFLEPERVDRMVCLGDIVGYNPAGNACVRIMRERSIECIAGNHELIALGRMGFDRCAPSPAHALRQARRDLSTATRQFLGALPATRTYEGKIVVTHGSVDDVAEYMSTSARILANAEVLAERHPGAMFCFFGHTHVPKVYEVGPGTLVEVPATGVVRVAGAGKTYFINPGSIDASRCREKLAHFAVFDSERQEVRFHGVAYDDGAVERAAAAAGYRLSVHRQWLEHARKRLKTGLSRLHAVASRGEVNR
ncbi:MAG: metallophosphoesterase family protein [Polyangiaceae bacterium]